MVRPLFEDAAPAQGPSPDGPASGQPLFQPTPTTPLPGLFVPGSVSAPAQAAAPQALFTDGEKSQLDALRGAARRDTVLSAIPLDQLDALWRELIPFSEASIRDYGAEAVAANESLSRTLAREMENFSRLRLAEASDELLKWLANPPRFKWFGASLGELEAAVRSGQRGTQIVIDRLLPIKTSTTALCQRADLQCLALTAPLLVGADGRDSWVRESAGLAAVNTPYGEKGVVANFATEKPHRNRAFQWFRDDGVLAYLPLPGNRISIVWSTPDAHADSLCALPAELFCDRVGEAGEHVLGRLACLTPPAAFPLRLMRVPQTVAPRLALVGDAAHGIHPLSGHGINLGFQDAKVLAELLAATQPWQDIGDERLLQRYQRARREETVMMQMTTDSLRRLFRQSPPGLRPLRNWGLNLTNALPFVKNALVRYALGAL